MIKNFSIIFLSVLFSIILHAYTQLVPIPGIPNTNNLNTNLKQIIILVRHGSRAPIYSYPTDPYGPSYWDKYGGLGQITPRGLLQTYIYGQFLKNYYINFLTPAYSPSRVYVRSIDLDISLMSASSFLAGLYPPANADQLWSPSVSWYPIPIHTNERYLDPIFVDPCPQYDGLVQNALNTPSYQNLLSQYANFIQNMSQLSGLQPLNYVDLWKLYDNAIAKANNGVPLEPWLADAFQTLAAANDFRVNLLYGDINKAQLVSGSLLYDIGNQIRNKTKNSNNEIYIYSCQDAHINSILTLLNATNHLDQVPFATALIFELRQDPAGLYYVQLIMQKNSTAQPFYLQPINIGTCDQLCPLGNFFDLISNKQVPDLRDVCFADNSNGGGGYQPFPPTNTKYPCTPNANGTGYYPSPPRKGLSMLELGLIIGCSILGAIILGLIITIGLVCYRNRIRKETF